jgi:hypothetical protein
MPNTQRVIIARVVIEADNKEIDRVAAYTISSLKSSGRHLRGGAMAIDLSYENGEKIGMDVTGSPSEEMHRLMNSVFSEGDE